MMPKKCRGTLLYLGILGASVGVVGVRTLPVASAGPSVVSSVPSGSQTSHKASHKASHTASTKSSVATVRVTGHTIKTRNGPVQAAVTFKGSRITDVTVLQTPNRDGRSIQIASRAVPTLHDEVLASQSAHIDTVSGATYTSDGYAQSVQSAIDQHG
jgi:uncharacterized protein with FMN-binding domain